MNAKVVGNGFNGFPLREIRLAVTKSFVDGRLQVLGNGVVNHGYTGQTLETFAAGAETMATERRVGVPARSYASLSALYTFGR